MNLEGVPAREFPLWAKRLEWHFNSFEERSGGSWTADDYRKWVHERDAQCWVVIHGGEVMCCGLTQIRDDRCKTCEAIACAGEDAESWAHLIEGVAFWAKSQGCKKLRLTCRPGWERVLGGEGFKKTHVMLDKEL